MKAPVSMCLIVRGESLLEEALLSARPHVEELVVVVTSSKDAASLEIARKHADRVDVFEGCNEKDGVPTDEIWDFSAARNHSFALASKPWISWMDADDVLSGGDKLPDVVRFLESGSQGKPTIAMFPYEYSVDEFGKCNCLQDRERLVTRGPAFRWANEVHEIIIRLRPDSEITQVPNFNIGLVWQHQRHKSKAPREGGRNLRILRWVIEKRPDDLRSRYYLASSCADAGLWDEARVHFEKYVDAQMWNEEEKTVAMLRMADICLIQGRFDEAATWAMRAINVKESWPDGYLSACKVHYLSARNGKGNVHRHWERCAYFGKMGLERPPSKTTIYFDPLVGQYHVHQYMNEALNAIGDVKGAVEAATRGLAFRPQDTNLEVNKLIFEERLARDAAKEAVGKLKTASNVLREKFKWVRPSDDAWGRVERAIEDPGTLGASEAVSGPASPVAERLPTDKLDIAFVCGPGWETWNPDVLKTSGLGGSETAVIEMSRRLAAKGHRVRVYAGCGEDATWDGVEWKNVDWNFGTVKADVVVVWRNAAFLDRVEAPMRLLWVHDIWALNPTRENLAKATRVLALSAWHRGFLAQHHAQHGLDAEKIVVTRNGIDLARFASQGSIAREPHKIVYSSSADRGLESLLLMWPAIRARVPDATLHIFYGFYNWEKMAQHGNDAAGLARIAKIKEALFDLRDRGVVYRGRVDQATLAREFLSAGVWAYPTLFSETNCITAAEAHAAGLRMVTSPIAALNETVGNRGILVAPEPEGRTRSYWDRSPDFQTRFVDAVVAAMQPSVTPREDLQKYARDHFSWDSVADEWVGMMWGLMGVQKVEIRPELAPPVSVSPDAYIGAL